jgi:hypothetical protein
MQNVTIDAHGSIDQGAADIISADQEMRTAVEHWARARGVLPQEGAMRTRESPPWFVVLTERGELLVRRIPGSDRWDNVSPRAALVWALVLEARPLRDGSRCKRCRGQGFKIVGANYRCISCPYCEGTRLADETDAYAQHVLNAQPSDRGFEKTVAAIIGRPVNAGSPASIEALHVLADRLQAAADPLGLDIALLLAGSREGTASAGERLRLSADALPDEFDRRPSMHGADHQ